MDTAAYRGCLLGLAVGDAMGFPVDEKLWDEICADYGPNGLLGYDLVNGTADVTSYTQLAAFVSNGLLLGVTRGNKNYLRYITVSLREWARGQIFHRDPEDTGCWIAKEPSLGLHLNQDARMLDALRFDTLGALDAPRNRNEGPGVLPGAVAIGMFYTPERMSPEQIGTLAAQTAALTHGEPETILSAAALAYTVAAVLRQKSMPLREHIQRALQVIRHQFGQHYRLEADRLAARVNRALQLADDPDIPARNAMEQLQCTTAPECLAGAVYAAVIGYHDFDAAMIAAVNHSGRSAATGAIAGALLGAKLTEQSLPSFYLESLTCADVLRELSEDLTRGKPSTGLFDDDWDQKYVQGLPL